MRIIIDGMGGDNAPAEIVKGVCEAARIIDDELVIVGIRDEIEAELKKQKDIPKGRVRIMPASEVIRTEDAPVKAIRQKKDSSIVVGLNMIKEGEGDVFVSAGNTGALLAGGLFILGRIQGIDRPALATIYPILGSHPALLIDAGANTECKPNNMLEFAVMGSIYMEKVAGVTNPRVGLVNNGAEETKGSMLTKASYELISKSNVNFVGNVEARDIPSGACDVIVCDGFVGNVIIKLTEGLATTMLKAVKSKITEGATAKIGAALVGSKLKTLKDDFDYSEYGGAPILGVKGPIIKMHGSSDANAVKNAILVAKPYVENNVVQIIQNSVEELEEINICE